MKQKIIAIRCITEESKGFGHFSRCLSLGLNLKKKGFKIIFIINKKNSVIKELKKNRFKYIIIPKSFSYYKEFSFILKTMNLEKIDSIIIDMREYGEKITKQISNNFFKVILLDDGWCDLLHADIIFNGTVLKGIHKYTKINKHAKLFFDSKYFLTNLEFQKHQKKNSDINKKKKYNVTISMGGSDPNELTLKVINSIIDLKNINLKIIIGPFYQDLKKLDRSIKKLKSCSVIKSPNNIWKYFEKSDIVISNAGSTLFELAIQKIPTISISAVEHQIIYANEFSKKGFSINLGFWKKIEENNIHETVSELLQNQVRRKKISYLGNSLVDGKGLSRTSNIITKFLLSNN
jgi:UDP-2,4-diacetamido-2,4,6-trideoxy-beta-L-altropyranose hydrolase